MHQDPHSHVLQLDLQGTPQAWISLEQAALHVATGSVAWVDGDGDSMNTRRPPRAGGRVLAWSLARASGWVGVNPF